MTWSGREIGSRWGQARSGLPWPSLPALDTRPKWMHGWLPRSSAEKRQERGGMTAQSSRNPSRAEGNHAGAPPQRREWAEGKRPRQAIRSFVPSAHAGPLPSVWTSPVRRWGHSGELDWIQNHPRRERPGPPMTPPARLLLAGDSMEKVPLARSRRHSPPARPRCKRTKARGVDRPP